MVTIPIAILGFYIMPDLPSTTRPSAIYTRAHIEIAKQRMESVGRKPPAKFTREKVIGFFKTWHLYLFTLREYSVPL